MTFRDTPTDTEEARERRRHACDLLIGPRTQRAVGVNYKKSSEVISHYFHASLPRQFDAIIHVDTTHALRPLM